MTALALLALAAAVAGALLRLRRPVAGALAPAAAALAVVAGVIEPAAAGRALRDVAEPLAFLLLAVPLATELDWRDYLGAGWRVLLPALAAATVVLVVLAA